MGSWDIQCLEKYQKELKVKNSENFSYSSADILELFKSLLPNTPEDISKLLPKSSDNEEPSYISLICGEYCFEKGMAAIYGKKLH